MNIVQQDNDEQAAGKMFNPSFISHVSSFPFIIQTQALV